MDRQIVLFDGTWNDPEDMTNVFHLCRLIEDDDGDIDQNFFYDSGVGTSRWTRLRGGTFGYGLKKNLLEGYDWLCRKHRQDDQIWIFGFSRGAYTARSLAGLISKCGLLHVSNPRLLEMAEKLYRTRIETEAQKKELEDFKKNYCSTPRIYFIGVWDTVGSLGIPGTFLSEKGVYSWLDTRLSENVDFGYHAMALDEHRAAYDATLWRNENGVKKEQNVHIEQRWFVGAHANVGGGYGAADTLPSLPLKWMLEKANAAGLRTGSLELPAEAWKQAPKDSYKEFLNGVYSIFRSIRTFGKGRHYRSFSHKPGELPAVNVTVDDSVWEKWRADGNYRPKTLLQAGLTAP